MEKITTSGVSKTNLIEYRGHLMAYIRVKCQIGVQVSPTMSLRVVGDLFIYLSLMKWFLSTEIKIINK